MKKIIKLFALFLFGVLPALHLSAQTVIGADAPDPSAMLDVQSTSKGFLPPRMTTAERNAISNPATGLLVFNTTLNCIEMNVGAPAQPAWACLLVACTVSAASATPTLDVNTALTPITHTTTGATGIGTPTGLPAGVTAAWASNTITISGTPTASGTYNYSIPLADGCGSVSATGTITVNASISCGAYVAAGVWKAFKCHNLGADENADPFTPDWKLNGAYYQWGYSTVAAAGPTGPSSGEANDGAINGWNTTAASNGAWADGNKTLNDPCPAGFRVPTRAQWDAVLDATLNPTPSYPGTWSTSSTNYSSGLRIGSGATGLFLPAAGFRDFSDGTLFIRGSFGYYWSSTETGSFAFGLGFYNGFAESYSVLKRTDGVSVRCIAE
jgi:uncharacterized protein (TIGR02145 family)